MRIQFVEEQTMLKRTQGEVYNIFKKVEVTFCAPKL